MLRQMAFVLPLFTAVALAACRSSADRTKAPATPADARAASRAPATQSTSFTGTLRGGVMAIGGESTGWRLEGDAQTGGIDVDVSKITTGARELDGKRVTLTGRMTTRAWVERGPTQVLVAEKIEPAPLPGK